MFSKTDIEQYFIIEKRTGLFFLVAGLIGLSLSCYFFLVDPGEFQRGVAIPFLAGGFIQVILGYGLYVHSDRQRIDNVYAYDMNPSRLQDHELARLEQKTRSFLLRRWVEYIVLAIGIALALVFCNSTQNMIYTGIGLGLLIQALMMRTVDFISERRMQRYRKGIRNFLQIQ